MILADIEKLLPWSEGTSVSTRVGPKRLRKAPLPQGTSFWSLWKGEKEELKELGVSVKKDAKGNWEANWWLDLDPKAAAAAQAARDAAIAQRQAARAAFSAEITPAQQARLDKISDKLLAYQLDPTKRLTVALDTFGGAVDASDTGSGKTYTTLATSIVLERPVFVICPKAVIPSWKRVAFNHFEISISCCNYELLRRGGQPALKLLNPGKDEKFEWNLPKNTIIIFDECHRCFPGDVRVLTDQGEIPIKEIVEKKLQISCMSRNLSVDENEFKPITGYFKFPKGSLVRVWHESGSIVCTPDHRFWCEDTKTWQPAIALEGRLLRRVWPSNVVLRQSEKVLQSQMLCRDSEEASPTDYLRILRDKKSASMEISQEKSEALLQSEMCGFGSPAEQHLQTEKTFMGSPSQKQTTSFGKHVTRAIESEFETKASCFTPDEESQPGNINSCEGNNIQTSKRTNLLGTGWERKGHIPTDHTFSSLGKSLENGICNNDGRSKRRVPSESLQGGHCPLETKNSYRSGRSFAQNTEMEVSRPPENKSFVFSRVVRVEILEPRDRQHSVTSDKKDQHVYCLEVEGNHNFYAEGVLVSNCKDYRTYNCKMGLAAADNPLQMKFIGGLCRLFPVSKFWQWTQDNGCVKGNWGMEFVGGNKILQRLHEEIFPLHGTRIRIADLGDAFPETQITAECYDLNGNTTALNSVYDEMDAEIARIEAKEEADSYKQACVLTAQLRARQRAEILKVPATAAMAQDLADEGMSVAIFCNYDDTVNALMAKLGTDCVIRGGQTTEEREANIQRFQALRRPRAAIHYPTPSAQDAKQALGRVARAPDEKAPAADPGIEPSPFIIANIRAGGVGIGLHDLNGSKSIQRIFFASGTIEEQVCRQVQTKVDRLDLLNDGDLSLTGEVRQQVFLPAK